MKCSMINTIRCVGDFASVICKATAIYLFGEINGISSKSQIAISSFGETSKQNIKHFYV